MKPWRLFHFIVLVTYVFKFASLCLCSEWKQCKTWVIPLRVTCSRSDASLQFKVTFLTFCHPIRGKAKAVSLLLLQFLPDGYCSIVPVRAQLAPNLWNGFHTTNVILLQCATWFYMTNILFCNKMGNQTNRFALFLILILPLLYRIMDFQVVETDALLLAIYNCASVTCYGQKRGARNKSSKNYFSGTLKNKRATCHAVIFSSSNTTSRHIRGDMISSIHLHLIYSREWHTCNPQCVHHSRKEKVALKKYQWQYVHLLGITIVFILCKLTCPQATLICNFQPVYEISSHNLGIKLLPRGAR